MAQNKSYTVDLTKGSILKGVILFSIPLVASSILQLLFNAVDVMVVGKFAGDDAMGAVGSTGPIINLITNVFMGLSVGTNVLVARFFAGKQKEELRKTVHTSILVSLLSGLVLVVVGGIIAKKLLEWTGSPDGIIELATLYLRIYFCGMPASMVYNFGAAILRGVGDTKRPLYYLSAAGVINVVLNLLFVIVFHWNVAGVGIATVISQTISALLVVRCLSREQEEIRLQRSYLKVDCKILRQIIQIGLPAGLQSSMFSLSNVVVQSSINSFGNIAVSGNAAAQNLEAFLAMEVKALSQATTAYVSQNMGAKAWNRINKSVLIVLLTVFVLDGLLGNLMCLFGEPLLSLYTNEAKVIQEGMIRITMACSVHAIYGLMDVMAGALRGLGRSVGPMIVSLVGVCAFRMAWIAVLFTNEAYRTIETIYIAYPISWSITFLAYGIYYVISWKKMKKEMVVL